MKTMNASEFKSRCLALLDEVSETGEAVIVLKRGKAVAQLMPVVPLEPLSPQESLKGTVEILGDIVAPALPPEAWEAQGNRR